MEEGCDRKSGEKTGSEEVRMSIHKTGTRFQN